MTTRLYYQDAYLKEFDATVTACLADGDGYLISLDRTAFYPEGGGQPCDCGVLIYEENTVAVTDTQEADGTQFPHGEIVHFCRQPIPAGTSVHGKLDWQRRITNMREHSGEHIISGIICSSYQVNNVGFHMGKDAVTIDFDGMLSPEQIFAAQQKANLKIMENVPVLAEYPDPQTLSSLYYRSKKELEGDVRIITIPGADVCACCGTHVRTTGEVGPICVTGTEHFKSGVRLTLLIGEKALADYAQKTENIRKISTLLSARPELTADAVDRLQNAYTQLKTEYTGLRLELLDQKVEAIPAGTPGAVLFEQELSPMELRKLADKLQAKTDFAAVFSGNDTEGYKYVICAAKMDIAAFGKAFNAALNGRGGGRPPMIQGSLLCTRSQIEKYLEETCHEYFR
ncbi:MAG: alanyl-tRNA editing protein [Lachnospiraceae bacterium]|nr:alanyl-tRNA editing protein [Lachnospiraceae bacterium]